jgi:FKBP-type peptidyl-prolyl cis-trans isomerase FkpA
VTVSGVARRTFGVFVCLVFCVGVAGCDDTNNNTASPSRTVPFSQSDLLIGTGAEAVNGKVLTVNYTGWFLDPTKSELKGLQFDTSVGSTPFAFTLGIGQVIAGWDQGLPGMKVGGLRRLVIPADLAYGSIRSGPVPPYATLIFEVELLEVQ